MRFDTIVIAAFLAATSNAIAVPDETSLIARGATGGPIPIGHEHKEVESDKPHLRPDFSKPKEGVTDKANSSVRGLLRRWFCTRPGQASCYIKRSGGPTQAEEDYQLERGIPGKSANDNIYGLQPVKQPYKRATDDILGIQPEAQPDQPEKRVAKSFGVRRDIDDGNTWPVTRATPEKTERDVIAGPMPIGPIPKNFEKKHEPQVVDDDKYKRHEPQVVDDDKY
ncbi:hypothetical protein KEM55_005357 [Ascosphaera atra]|nr:hypothetical protein KEM55_005357 [Ascosphaera atra]